MSDDLDRVMNEDPLNLTDVDLDKIILYERKMRQAWLSGVKPTKEAKAPTMDIDAVITAMSGDVKEDKPKIIRRV